jgi:hypothetical protein
MPAGVFGEGANQCGSSETSSRLVSAGAGCAQHTEGHFAWQGRDKHPQGGLAAEHAGHDDVNIADGVFK